MNSLTIGTVIGIITVPCMLYKHSPAQRYEIRTLIFQKKSLSLLGIINLLTSPSEDFWPVPSNFLFDFRNQALRSSAFDTHQPTDF